jgi:hypothetical protein
MQEPLKNLANLFDIIGLNPGLQNRKGDDSRKACPEQSRRDAKAPRLGEIIECFTLRA